MVISSILLLLNRMLPKRGAPMLLDSLRVLADTDRRLRKPYNTFVVLAGLMNSICSENHWAMRLKELINDHHMDKSKMGFPNYWQQKDIWK